MSKERPILMSAPMVRAILAGRTSQTRRAVKPTQSAPKVPPLTMEPWIVDGDTQEDDDGRPLWIGTHPDYPTGDKWFSCPYGAVGDRLWCRETFAVYGEFKHGPGYCYRADGDLAGVTWKPSIFMPRALSRITLEITEVRVERVQDISEEDAAAEGVSRAIRARLNGMSDEEAIPLDQPLYGGLQPTHRNAYATLWDNINGAKYPWSCNPWVWCIAFQRVTP